VSHTLLIEELMKTANKATAKPKAVRTKRANKTRAALHKQHFVAYPNGFPTASGFIPQVTAYGTPMFAHVGSVAGI
jgi:hypothetical protein